MQGRRKKNILECQTCNVVEQLRTILSHLEEDLRHKFVQKFLRIMELQCFHRKRFHSGVVCELFREFGPMPAHIEAVVTASSRKILGAFNENELLQAQTVSVFREVEKVLFYQYKYEGSQVPCRRDQLKKVPSHSSKKMKPVIQAPRRKQYLARFRAMVQEKIENGLISPELKRQYPWIAMKGRKSSET